MTIRYDQQTRDRAIRLWLEHVQDGASKSAADRAVGVGELLDIKPALRVLPELAHPRLMQIILTH